MCTNRFLPQFKITPAVTTIVAGMLALAGPSSAADPPKLQPATTPSPVKSAESVKSQADMVRKATPAERATADRMDPLTRAAFWSKESSVDPSDAVAGVKLSAALRQMGRYEEADASAAKVLALHPDDYDALLETARARISARQGFYAIQPLKLAMKLKPKEWKPLSLMGVALEQSERPDDARAAYQQALSLSPDNPAVLSNLAMSYAAIGDRQQAEQLLRRAVAQPDATIQERQNLALVLGMNGQLVEAERLIREDLPPEMAAANLAYLRSLQTSAAAPSPK